MGALSNLEPEKVFYFFEEITKIPHGSGNVDKISDYLVAFARERGILCIQDELKNIIMIKEASQGYENEPAVILQGHMDMVAVKKPECSLDMRTEGLRVAVDGDNVYAEDTSLGGDDGIAVAFCLALLDSDTIKHPRLEIVITVDEEVGMDGARRIDLSMLTGSRMINLDSEEEGIFLTSCAGGARVKCGMSLSGKKRGTDVTEGEAQNLSFGGEGSCGQDFVQPMIEKNNQLFKLTVGGLLGGHSGGEIHKERGNSNCIFGRVLYSMTEKLPVCLVSGEGGLADNAIPRETKALLLVPEKGYTALEELVRVAEKEIQAELAVRDPNFFLQVEKKDGDVISCFTSAETRQIAAFLCALPNGVQAMSPDMQGLVETSLNLGILKIGKNEKSSFKAGNDGEVSGQEWEVLAEFSVRSSVESEKRFLIQKLNAVTELADGSIQVTGDYPGWKFRKDSPLRRKMVALYEKMYGAEPKVEAIHAGLECGILGSKIKDLDCVSIGPNMRDIHTTEETLSISSTRRVWEYLVALLEEKDNAETK